MRLKLLAWTAALFLTPVICFGQIIGSVKLVGEPPEMAPIKGVDANPLCAAMHKDPVYDDSVVVGDNNELANVIVFIDPGKDKTLPGPKKQIPAVLDQKGCMYTPHVLALQVGQPVLVKNSDPFMHNVHALCINNTPFNVAEVAGAQQNIKPFTDEEQFPIKCDVHSWMKVVVRVFDHPYFAVTDDKGKYTIDTTGLPDGNYTVKAWQEVYHESQPQQVEIKSGKPTKSIDFTFQSKSVKKDAGKK